MFFAREKELAAIRKTLGENGNVMVYGQRRVGKTTLIREAVKEVNADVVWFECVEGNYEYNIQLLAKSASLSLNRSYMSNISDLFDLMDAINEIGKRVVIVIDEYPYMKTGNRGSSVDSYFQRIIDRHYENISLVLCGSFISMMKELLESDNPLFGRFSLQINLKQFDYKDASLFYPNVSTRQKIEFYAVFGGYPFILELLDQKLSLEENIEKLLLGTYSVREEVENTILKEISKIGISREIIARIGNSRLRFKEIEDAFKVDVRGSLDRELKRLIDMQLITKSYPINKKDDKKKSFYELNDNLLRFYYSFIFPVKSRLVLMNEKAFFSSFIAPKLNTFISKRFEGLAKEYFVRRNISINDTDIIDIGTYWYDDKVNKKNGEFDCVLETRDNEYCVYEVKYLQYPMTRNLIEEEVFKINAIPDLKIKTIGMISSSGFACSYDGIKLISGEDLYALN